MKKHTFKRSATKAFSLAMAFAMSASIGMSGLTAAANIADNLDPNRKYSSEFASYQDYIDYSTQVNIELASEGFVLLKNKDNALPFAAEGKKVTVFGTGADSLVAGGGGSGSQARPKPADVTEWLPQNTVSVLDSLRKAGYEVNPEVENVYKTVNSVQMPSVSGSFGRNSREGGKYMNLTEDKAAATAEFAGNYYVAADNCSFSSEVEATFEEYGDAAVVVISRSGSEGADNPTNNVAGHTDVNEHYNELDDAEKELMAYAKAHFERVFVIINSPSAMELRCVEEDDDIDAMLWIGQPGFNGAWAIGKIFNGEVNPSAKTVDFYMNEFESDPTWYNFGNYTAANYAVNGEYGNSTSTVVMNGAASTGSVRAMDYAEGIYMGYRYYETVAVELGDKGEEWYQENTVYPFGFGLSYTTFTQEITNVAGDINSANGEVSVTVKVTNTGDVAGKDVVQLYVSKPYTKGGIEKSAVDLVDFAKTSKLAPGASEELTITVSAYDLASFDYNDKNNNKFIGWELEAGDYVFSIRADSHRVLDSDTVACTTASTWEGDEDANTPNAIYSQKGNNWEQFNTLAHNWTTGGVDHYLTRDALVDDEGNLFELKKLSWLLTEANDFRDEVFATYNAFGDGFAYRDGDNFMTTEVESNYVNPWNKTEVPEDWTQGAGVLNANGKYDITLYEMQGVALDNPMWTEFMNQLTWDELILLINAGNGGSGYGNSKLDSINKPWITDQDGPGQLGANSMEGMAWVCEVVQGSTWNKELCYEQGRCVGIESLYINAGGWYGPALNTHRSPFAGRNFEYFSQDGVQGGLIAAAVIKGATDMGVHVYAKHSFLNDQETNREKTCTFATEQAIREIYARQFELTVTEGNCNGFMNAFNRIGAYSSAGYATGIQLYDNEWGFDGFSVTDYWGTNYAKGSGWTGYMMTRGMTMPLNRNTQTAQSGIGYDGIWDADKNMVMVWADKAAVGSQNYTLESPTQWYYVRMSAQRLLYTVVNGNALKNGLLEIALATDLKPTQYVETGYVNVLNVASRRALAEFFGAAGYEITNVSGLPAGMAHAGNGVVYGAPTASGNFTVTVAVAGLDAMSYLKGNLTLTMNVTANEAGKPAEVPTVAIGQDKAWKETALTTAIYAPAIGTDFVLDPTATNTAANVGKLTKFAIEVTGLPAGLTVDERGNVTGTVTADAGVYNVNVKITYTEIYEQRAGRYRTRNVTAQGEVALTVENGAMPQIAIMNGFWFIDGVNTGVPVTGANGTNGLHGMPGMDGMNGADGKDGVGIAGAQLVDGVLTLTLTDGTVLSVGNVMGPQGPAGEAGPAGESALAALGCGSTVAGAAIVAIAAMAVVVLRKKED